jgi:pSer/pThr/pTyr-binding forkhead associated (FHA) protein
MLVVKRGRDEGKSVPVQEQVAIGADQKANVMALSDRNVSGRHGVVRLEQGVHVYHDLASTNGSWLVGRNGEKTRITGPVHLMHGDTIEIGQTRIVYMEEGK